MFILTNRRFRWWACRCSVGGETALALLHGIVCVVLAFSAQAAVVEFFDPDLNNYFITADPTEQAFVDSGTVGRWQRTGNTFATGGTNQVCRFYGNSNINPVTGTIYGPNSHFYTADSAECAGLKAMYTPSAKSWKFESNDFLTTPAVNSTCPSGLAPVYRAYNNGFAKGVDSNHRITSNYAAYKKTVASGSIGEGIVMCAPLPIYDFMINGIQQARISFDYGVPRLLINEQPVPPLLLWGQVQVPNRLAPLAPQVQFASANGIHIYSFELKIPWTGAYYGFFDAAMDRFIAADPSAAFLLRIKEEINDQDNSLVFGPDEDNLYQDGTREPISVASDAYFNAYKSAIQRFIAHYENSSYAGRILGYHIGGGENLVEWFPRDYRNKGLDYSGANTEAFRNWLRQRYGTDASLDQAWGRTVTLNGATIPLPQPGRFPLHLVSGGAVVEAFYRLPDEQDWVDYSAYISDIITQRILDLASLVKDATHRKKLVAFYNGYIFELPGSMNGDLRMDRLLNSPDIDMLAAPISYIQETDRLAGGPAGAMTALDSIAAHGKLWMNEDDLRTHIAAASGLPDIGYNGSHPTTNFAETYNVLLRNLASVLIHRGGTWWMDLNGTGAFNDPELWGVMSDFGLPLYEKTYANPSQYRPEVAVIVDQRSVTFEKNDYDFMLQARAFLRNAIAATGATIGYYYLEDFLDGTLPTTKIYLFANASYLSDDQISAIQARLTTEGGTAIWQYAPGYLGPSGPDVGRVSRLTGLTLQKIDGRGGSAGQGAMSNHVWGWAPNNPLSPRLVVSDSGAEALGHYRFDGLISSARKKVGTFQSIFLGDVGLTTDALREILRQSGAHIWTDDGEIVHTDGSLLFVHRKDAGATRIHLPVGTIAVPMTGSLDLVDGDGVDVNFDQYETRVFLLTR